MPVKQVWDALCAYCYLPRLRDQTVFVSSIRAGLESGDYFAYATSVSAQGRYEGLTLDASASVYLDATSVLVKPDVARAQREAEESAAGGATDNTGTTPANPETGSTTGSSDTAETPVIERRLPRRFFGTIRLDPIRAGRDMSVVTEEVVQHLSALPGAEVEVSVEISATVPDGVSETVRRIVDENCKALRFRSHQFDDE